MMDVSMTRAIARQPYFSETLSDDQLGRAVELWYERRRDTYDIALEIGASEAAVYNALMRGKDEAFSDHLWEVFEAAQ